MFGESEKVVEKSFHFLKSDDLSDVVLSRVMTLGQFCREVGFARWHTLCTEIS